MSQTTGIQCFPSFLFLFMFRNASGICSCSSIGQARSRMRERMEDERKRRIWRQVCLFPLHPTDRFPSHRASNLHSVQTNPSPLTRLCNSTHWRPKPGRLKTSSRPHKCSQMLTYARTSFPHSNGNLQNTYFLGLTHALTYY